MSELENLLKKYAVEPSPQSVARLGQLVMKRDADIEEIVKVISSDIGLKVRLLRAANPTDGNLKIESVHEAVVRAGVGCVLVLAMSEPLIKALIKTFITMAATKLDPVNHASIGPLVNPHFLGSAKFWGKASGVVYIRLEDPLARRLAAHILGTTAPEELDAGVQDVLGELVNMVVGSFKSNLCDAGLSCKLSLPTVSLVSDFHLPPVAGGRHQMFAFRATHDPVLLNIVVDSTE